MERLGLELVVRALFVTLQQRGQAFGCVPAIKRVAKVIFAAYVAEPDAAFGSELAQIRATVGREDEGQTVGVLSAPVLRMQRCLFTRSESTAVAFGLLQGAGDIGVLALGLDRSHRREADEEDVVGRAARGGPLSNS